MHLNAFRIACVVTALLSISAANAQTLVYTCKDPSGRALGTLGQLGSFKGVDEPESMKGGVITLQYRLRDRSAQITVETGSGGQVLTTKGESFFRSEEQVSFYAAFPGAAYMFSIYLPGQRLLVSAHQQFLSMDPGSALAKTFQAQCERTIRPQ